MSAVTPLLQELSGIAHEGLGKALGSVGIGGEFRARLLDATQLGSGKIGVTPSLGAVGLEPGLDLDLTDEQMRRIAEAADRAHLAGAEQALVMIDGKALRVDVQQRRILGEASMQHGDVLIGIDAVVQASEPGGSSDFNGLLSPGGSAMGVHPGILRALAK